MLFKAKIKIKIKWISLKKILGHLQNKLTKIKRNHITNKRMTQLATKKISLIIIQNMKEWKDYW